MVRIFKWKEKNKEKSLLWLNRQFFLAWLFPSRFFHSLDSKDGLRSEKNRCKEYKKKKQRDNDKKTDDDGEKKSSRTEPPRNEEEPLVRPIFLQGHTDG